MRRWLEVPIPKTSIRKCLSSHSCTDHLIPLIPLCISSKAASNSRLNEEIIILLLRQRVTHNLKKKSSRKCVTDAYIFGGISTVWGYNADHQIKSGTSVAWDSISDGKIYYFNLFQQAFRYIFQNTNKSSSCLLLRCYVDNRWQDYFISVRSSVIQTFRPTLYFMQTK